MKKILKNIGFALLAIFIIIQFFRPTKNIAPIDATKQITAKFEVPQNVEVVLKKACYDCHSNNTKYPWYSQIQPIAWWLNEHVVDGKKEINFDEFSGYKLRRQYHKFEEIVEQVKTKEMPLNSYTWVHGEALLTNEERLTVTNWATAMMDTLKVYNPIDSLIKKKK